MRNPQRRILAAFPMVVAPAKRTSGSMSRKAQRKKRNVCENSKKRNEKGCVLKSPRAFSTVRRAMMRAVNDAMNAGNVREVFSIAAMNRLKRIVLSIRNTVLIW